MGIVMGSDTATNTQPAASPGRWLQCQYQTVTMGTGEEFFLGLLILLLGLQVGYWYCYRKVGKGIMKGEIDKNFRKPMREAFNKFNPRFPQEIENLSPTFCEIFVQATDAEQDELSQICGIGYGKSLEFLIKDYAIYLNPAKRSEIEKATLTNCIKLYVVDESIKNSSELATWLRNDETHYVRKWVAKDVNDLKNLITLTVTLISNNLLKHQLDKQVKEIKDSFK